jgi:hypothetical protein
MAEENFSKDKEARASTWNSLRNHVIAKLTYTVQ